MANGHGGARIGAGQKKRALSDKLVEGNPGKRKLTVMEFTDTADLQGETMPPPRAYLEARQKNGNEYLEPNRMTFDSCLPRNSESRAISMSLQLTKKYAPQLKWIRFADAYSCGDGTIYRARNNVSTDIFLPPLAKPEHLWTTTSISTTTSASS